MLKKISAMQARRQLGQIMNEVSITRDVCIVERAGKPLVAIVPIQDYERLQKDRERARKEFFDWVNTMRASTKDVDPAILEQEIAEAVKAVREERRERLKKPSEEKATELETS